MGSFDLYEADSLKKNLWQQYRQQWKPSSNFSRLDFDPFDTMHWRISNNGLENV